jgi:hypothetical protein
MLCFNETDIAKRHIYLHYINKAFQSKYLETSFFKISGQFLDFKNQETDRLNKQEVLLKEAIKQKGLLCYRSLNI